MIKRLLFISYNHDNLKIASSIQNHRLTDALRKYTTVDILCRSIKQDQPVFKISSIDLSLIDRALYKVFPFLKSVYSIDKLVWCIKAYYAVKKHISRYDYVLFPYEPYPTRILQRLIRNNSKARIVSVLYDPYYDNLFFSQSWVGKFIRKKIEKSIVYSSDYLVVNHYRMFESFKARYPSCKMAMIPFCGREKVITSKSENHHKLRVVHVGNIFGQRKIDSLNQTISILKSRIENLSKVFEIQLYGSFCEGYEDVVKKHNDDILFFKGYVEPQEADRVLADADALLLIDPIDERNYSYPSKLCEYFQYKKVIVAFAGKNTPSYLALKETHNIVHSGDELEEMAGDLQCLIKKGAINRTPQEYSNQFYPKYIANKYIEFLSSI